VAALWGNGERALRFTEHPQGPNRLARGLGCSAWLRVLSLVPPAPLRCTAAMGVLQKGFARYCRSRSSARAWLLLAALAPLGASVASGTAAAQAGASPPASAASEAPRADRGALVGRERCAANRAAGTITYLTGFQWEASVGILDPIAAKAEGFYADMCLSVRLVPGTGNPAASGQLVAAGRATLSELGSPEDAITDVAGTPSIPVDAVATYGNTTIDTLLTMPKITNLRQLDGKTIGYKGAMPPDITAMLEKAGVNLASIKEISVGYDPTILPRGEVQALTAYKSNEPVQLRDDGYKVREWDPGAFGIKGAFNVLDVNRRWAEAHPGALGDFLRATFEAFYYCRSHAAKCVEDAAKYEVGYPVRQNIQRWQIESGIVLSTLLPGHGVGYEDLAQWQPEYQLLRQFHLVSRSVNLAAIIDPAYVAAIYHGRSLIWPGP
jgi:ABC-type nitrate/sulfonate/bicarbonate transport system substrate-binding protein